MSLEDKSKGTARTGGGLTLFMPVQKQFFTAEFRLKDVRVCKNVYYPTVYIQSNCLFFCCVMSH